TPGHPHGLGDIHALRLRPLRRDGAGGAADRPGSHAGTLATTRLKSCRRGSRDDPTSVTFGNSTSGNPEPDRQEAYVRLALCPVCERPLGFVRHAPSGRNAGVSSAFDPFG